MKAFFSNSPVFVSGGCGFIGSHLVQALVARGARVTVLDNLQSGQWSNLGAAAKDVQRIEGDIRDAALVTRIVAHSQPTYIFHLAANASVPGSVEDPAYDFETNGVGTFNLLNAVRTAGKCEKIVTASSGAVYGQPDSFPIHEGDPTRPISPYGASKVSAETTANMFHAVYGLPVVIARIFNTYGPQMARFVILDFLRKLDRDPSVLEILGNGSQIRDFTYVSDIVAGLVLLAQGGSNGDAYNVSSGSSCSVTELAKKMIAVLGLESRTGITYTGKSWVGDAQRWEVSIEKIRQIGYAPRISLEEGLRRTVDWFHSPRAIPVPDLQAATGLASYEDA